MILLKFEKTINGESNVKGHDKWIIVDSMQFGVGRAISSVGGGGDRETSNPSFSEVTFSKAADLSSADLFMQSISGKSLGQAELHFVNVRDQEVDTYLTLIFADAIVASYSASSGGDRPSESFALNYTKMSFQYDKWSGGTKTTGTAKKWDIQKNTQWA